MDYLLTVLLAIHSLLLVNIWLNRALILPRLRDNALSGITPAVQDASAKEIQPSVSILVPARNEAKNLPRLIHSFREQLYTSAELVIYDDQSDDTTWEILEAASTSDDMIRAIKGSSVPDGWIGKVHACHHLADQAKGELFLFLDADTEFLHSRALQCVVEHYHSINPDTVITGIPEIRGGGFLIVSMVGHFILSLVPLWLRNKNPFSIFAGVNGQCWMIHAGLYRNLMPHAAVRDQVLEDIMIGRYLHANGVKPILVNFRSDLAVYMYTNMTAAWNGFRKNASAMLGKNLFTALGSWLIYVLLYVVAPVLFPVLFLTQIVLKLSTDRAIGQPLWISLLTPISILLTAILAFDSIIARSRNRIVWKGRSI